MRWFSIAESRNRIAARPFPSPDSVSSFSRQRESQLVREHADLPPMVSFVRDHVGEHGCVWGPWPRPAVAMKLFDLTLGSKSFSQHLRAESGALRQGFPRLLLSAACAIELRRPLQMWG